MTTKREIEELREVVRKLVPMLAGKGIAVTQQGARAYVTTNAAGKPARVNIPMIPDNAEMDFILAIQGFIDHEVGHIFATNWKVVAESVALGERIARERGLDAAEQIKAGKRMHNLHNIVEDPYVEAHMRKKFPGSAYNLDCLYKLFVRKITLPALEKVKGDPAKEFSVLLVPVVRAWAGQAYFDDFLKESGYWKHPLVDAFVKRVPEDVKRAIRNVKSSMDALAAAEELFHILYPPPPPAPPSACEDEDEKESESSSRGSETDDGAGKSKPSDESDDGEESESAGGSGAEGEGDGDESDDDDGASRDEGEDESESEKDEAGDDDEDEAGDDDDEEDAGEDDESDDAGDADEGEDGETDADAGEDDAGDDSSGSGEDEEDAEEADDDKAGGDGEDEEEKEAEDDLDGPSSDETTDEGEDGEDSKESGGGGDAAPGLENPFSEVDVEVEDKDLSSEIAKVLTDDATRSTRGADYRVFTRDYDIVDVPDDISVKDEKSIARLDEVTRHMVAPMQKDIERMMAARSMKINLPGYRSGRLHAGSLHRLRVVDDRVFRRRQEHKSKDTAVGLLIDNSGSMGGWGWGPTATKHNKMAVAMAAGYALSQTLERVGVKHEVVGFTTRNLPRNVSKELYEESLRIGQPFTRSFAIYMPIYKGFNERLTTAVRERFAAGFENNVDMSENIDGECVAIMVHRLLQRPEPRKVLLVLSDGHPACCSPCPHELYSDLHRAVEFAEKNKVETVGIGIMDSSVRDFYPKHVVLDDLNLLPKTVMGELKRILGAA